MAAKKRKAQKIGEFLVAIGAMKQWQVEDILVMQQAGDDRIFGEIAISFGYIDDQALRRYVEESSKVTQPVTL